MDTGLELPAAVLKAQHEHREYYATFLKNQRAQREARNKAQHQAANKMHSDPEAFQFGCDLGLDPYSGIAPFAPPLPQDLSPLFLFHPYTDGETAKRGETARQPRAARRRRSSTRFGSRPRSTRANPSRSMRWPTAR